LAPAEVPAWPGGAKGRAIDRLAAQNIK